jgi:hypothetical protein
VEVRNRLHGLVPMLVEILQREQVYLVATYASTPLELARTAAQGFLAYAQEENLSADEAEQRFRRYLENVKENIDAICE